MVFIALSLQPYLEKMWGLEECFAALLYNLREKYGQHPKTHCTTFCSVPYTHLSALQCLVHVVHTGSQDPHIHYSMHTQLHPCSMYVSVCIGIMSSGMNVMRQCVCAHM